MGPLKIVFRCILLLWLVCFVTAGIGPSIGSTADLQSTQRNILILHSYHTGFAWTEDQNDSFIRSIRQQGIEPVFHIEYMDWKYNPTEENLRLRYEQYKLRYGKQKIDLIYTTDDAALTFALKHRRELFSDAPVVFSGVMKGSAEKISQGVQNLTGVYEKFDAEGSVRLIKGFDPGLQRLYLLYDNSESGLQAAAVMVEEARRVDPKLEILHLNTARFGDVIQMLASLLPDSHSAVLANTYSRDVDGLSMEMERFIKLYSEKSAIPIYILYDFDSNQGAVGGILTAGHRQGEAAAQIGLRILRGEGANSMQPLDSAVFDTVLDYTQLFRYRLPLSAIPPGAVLINKPQSLYERHRETIWAVAVVFSVMSLFVALLLMHLRNRIHSEKKMAAARSYLDKIINSVPDPLHVKDAEGKWVLVNQAFADFFGRSREVFLGQTMFEVFPSEPGSTSIHYQNDQAVLADGQERTYISMMTDADGNHRIVESKKMRYIDPHGQRYVVGINRDITVIKQAEELLQRANEELEEKIALRTRELGDANSELTALNQEMAAVNETLQEANRTLASEVEERYRVEKELRETQEQLIQSGKLAALGSLVSGVAHEINTPLGNSVTAASYLQDSLKRFMRQHDGLLAHHKILDEYMADQQDGLRIVGDNLRRAVELINSFKNVAVNQLAEDQHVFSVHQLLADTLVMLQPQLRKTCLRVESECREELEWFSYPGVLSQVITSLVTNSLVHAYEPRQAGTLSIKIYRDNLDVVVEYKDDGCGMPEEVREKIFDPFFTTKRGSGGFGLGMYIVYNLVTQKLGGTITCESSPGNGSRFVIRVQG